MLELENRFYGPDSNAAEVRAIRYRVFAVEDDVFVWREMPKQTVFSVEVMTQALREKTRDLAEFYLIGDLTKAERPSSEVRQAIRDGMLSAPGLVHLSTMVGRNPMMLIAAKFVFAHLGLASWSVTKSLDESLVEIENIKKERRLNGG